MSEYTERFVLFLRHSGLANPGYFNLMRRIL